MRSNVEHKKIFKNNLVVVISICLTFYFSYHLIFSDRSYIKYTQLQNQKSQVLNESLFVEQQRLVLEGKVKNLRPSSLDKDLLEERVADVLGYVSRNDIVIIK